MYTELKVAGALLLLGFVTVTVPQRLPEAGQLAARAPRLEPRAEPPRDGAIVVTRVLVRQPAELFNPEGKSLGEVELGDQGNRTNACDPRFSPDGKRVAVLRQVNFQAGDIGGRWIPYELYVVEVDAKAPPAAPLVTRLQCPSFAWARDGKSLYVSSFPKEKQDVAENVGQVVPVSTRQIDVATGQAKAIALTERDAVTDLAQCGETVV